MTVIPIILKWRCAAAFTKWRSFISFSEWRSFSFHHPNDGHSFTLRSAIREPSRSMYAPLKCHRASLTVADFGQIWTTERKIKFRIFLAFFSAVYILFQHHGGCIDSFQNLWYNERTQSEARLLSCRSRNASHRRLRSAVRNLLWQLNRICIWTIQPYISSIRRERVRTLPLGALCDGLFCYGYVGLFFCPH